MIVTQGIKHITTLEFIMEDQPRFMIILNNCDTITIIRSKRFSKWYCVSLNGKLTHQCKAYFAEDISYGDFCDDFSDTAPQKIDVESHKTGATSQSMYGWIKLPYPMHIPLICADARIDTEYLKTLSHSSSGIYVVWCYF